MDPAGSVTYIVPTESNAIVNGQGILNKNGSGILYLSADPNSVNEVAVNVNQGEVNINGDIGGSVLVNLGCLLSGNGTVDSLTNNGTVSPGNSIGTMVMTGDYTQAQMLP